MAALLAGGAACSCLISPDPELWQSRDAAADGADAAPPTEVGPDGTVPDAAADAAPTTTSARLFYASSITKDLRTRTWNELSGTWGLPTSVSKSTDVFWTINRMRPSNKGDFVAVLSQGTQSVTLEVLERQGSAWSSKWSAAKTVPSAHSNKRSFDMELHSKSGNLMVVYSDNTATPVYRQYSEKGGWTPATSLPLNGGTSSSPTKNTGIVLWVELVPRPGSDEMLLLYADKNNDLVAISWDGWWKIGSSKTLETNLKYNPNSSLLNNRAFDGAFERTTGDVLVAWGTNSTSGYRYATRQAKSLSWSVTTTAVKIVNGKIDHVDLESDPGSNTIAGVFLDLGGGTERLGASFWQGTAWTKSTAIDNQIRDESDNFQGDFPGGVAWLGKTGKAVCVYSDADKASIDWALGTLSGGWIKQTDFKVNGMGYLESVQLVSYPGASKIMVLASDDQSSLYSLTYAGTWKLENDGFSLGTITSVISRPFSVQVSR